jgi:protein phosphatase methylesterase 1
MITISSNLATGFVVDVITNSTNIDDLHETSDPRWDAWIAKRRYTENLLKKLDLYDNQLVLSKTYPTNSGQIYGGAEQVIVNTWGKNLLQPCCAASLMLYIMESNGLTDEEKEYAKSVLFHTLDSNYTPTGRAYPAGTLFYDKSGEAYDTVEDISHFTLPNGQKGVLTIFSNGFQRGESDFYVIARFAEMILAKFQLNNGSPPTFTVTADQNITCSGPSAKVHKRDATSPDTIGNTFFTMSTSAGDTPDVCTIQVHIPKEGLYAVHVYTPTYDHMTDGSTTITFHDKYQASATAYQPRETMSSWAPVGEYIFTAGTLSMQITNANVKKASGEHVINAVRFSMYPLP